MIKYLQSGPLVVVMAFILWGLTPLFYKYLSGWCTDSYSDIQSNLLYSIVIGNKTII